MNSLLSPSVGVIFWQIIAFFFLLMIIKKFFLPTITRVLADRERLINESIAQAQEIAEKKNSLEKIEKQTLEELRQYKENVNRDIVNYKNDMVSKVKSEVAEMRSNMIDKSKKEVDLLEKNFITTKKEEICSLSISFAEELVKDHMSSYEAKKKFLDDFINNIDNIEVKTKG